MDREGNCSGLKRNLRVMSSAHRVVGSSRHRLALFAATVFILLCCGTAAVAGVPGTFRGTVHEGADIKPGWVYVEAMNGNLRLVDVRRADIHYEDPLDDDATPAVSRPKRAAPKLATGTEVRVTAEQDKKGYWHASEVEVLREVGRAK
jgi:hypothetical protein